MAPNIPLRPSRVPLLLWILLSWGFCSSAVAQTPLPAPPAGAEAGSRNAAYLELLGNGGAYSFNYERRMGEALGVRVGFARWDSTPLLDTYGSERITTVPMTVSYLPRGGGGGGGLEAGGGFLFGRKSSDHYNDPGIFALTGILGYRRTSRGSGFLFRATITPFMDLTGAEEAYPDPGLFVSAGLSLGMVF